MHEFKFILSKDFFIFHFNMEKILLKNKNNTVVTYENEKCLYSCMHSRRSISNNHCTVDKCEAFIPSGNT